MNNHRITIADVEPSAIIKHLQDVFKTNIAGPMQGDYMFAWNDYTVGFYREGNNVTLQLFKQIDDKCDLPNKHTVLSFVDEMKHHQSMCALNISVQWNDG